MNLATTSTDIENPESGLEQQRQQLEKRLEPKNEAPTQQEVDASRFDNYKGFVNELGESFAKITAGEITSSELVKLEIMLLNLLGKIEVTEVILESNQEGVESYSRDLLAKLVVVVFSMQVELLDGSVEERSDFVKARFSDLRTNSSDPAYPIYNRLSEVLPYIDSSPQTLFEIPITTEDNNIDLTDGPEIVDTVTIDVMAEYQKDLNQVIALKKTITDNIMRILNSPDTVAIERVFALIDGDGVIRKELGDNASLQEYVQHLMQTYLTKFVTVTIEGTRQNGGYSIATDADVKAGIALSQIREATDTAGVFDSRSYDKIASTILTGGDKSSKREPVPYGGDMILNVR